MTQALLYSKVPINISQRSCVVFLAHTQNKLVCNKSPISLLGVWLALKSTKNKKLEGFFSPLNVMVGICVCKMVRGLWDFRIGVRGDFLITSFSHSGSWWLKPQSKSCRLELKWPHDKSIRKVFSCFVEKVKIFILAYFSWGTKIYQVEKAFWFCEFCVHIDFTHSSIYLTQRFVIQSFSTWKG